MRTRFGTSAWQAIKRLLGLNGDPKGSVFNLAVEIRKLVSLAHPSMSVDKRELLSIDYLICDMDCTTMQRHILTADTTTVTNTVLATEEYLVVGGVDCVSCKAVDETDQLGRLAGGLNNNQKFWSG